MASTKTADRLPQAPTGLGTSLRSGAHSSCNCKDCRLPSEGGGPHREVLGRGEACFSYCVVALAALLRAAGAGQGVLTVIQREEEVGHELQGSGLSNGNTSWQSSVTGEVGKGTDLEGKGEQACAVVGLEPG